MENGRDDVMQNVKAYINENIQTAISVDELAGEFGMKASELYENFVRVYGVNPKKYISDKKMERLIALLQETGDQEIVYYYAHVLGFKTAGGITNFVKRRTGMNFSQFRCKLLEDGVIGGFAETPGMENSVSRVTQEPARSDQMQ